MTNLAICLHNHLMFIVHKLKCFIKSSSRQIWLFCNRCIMKIRIKYKSSLFAFSEKQYVKNALIIFIRSLLYFSCCIKHYSCNWLQWLQGYNYAFYYWKLIKNHSLKPLYWFSLKTENYKYTFYLALLPRPSRN